MKQKYKRIRNYELSYNRIIAKCSKKTNIGLITFKIDMHRAKAYLLKLKSPNERA